MRNTVGFPKMTLNKKKQKKEKKTKETRTITKLNPLTHHTGPIVRTAPNELSFNTAQSWRDIYGIRKGHEPFIKSEFYDGGNFAAEALSIVSERNPAKHSEMRKYLSSAFSDRSLREQEYLVAEIVDQFVEMLDDKEGGGGKELDLVNAFNLTTFDIIGSLAFGESFGGVASGLFLKRHCPLPRFFMEPFTLMISWYM